MPFRRRAACLFVCLVWPLVALAAPKTVCTITVNSSDEKQTFERFLPRDDYRFVELVERGRPDWLASACRNRVQCDALIISGHFDGGTEFYTDRLDVRESLPVHELERVSCSDSCPGLFSQLKEVYLFGCNTLNADAMRSASAEITRSLIRSGHSAADAAASDPRAGRALRREQSRPDAQHLQGRAGALRIFVEGAARPCRAPAARALLPDGARPAKSRADT